jgi:hypothetical protein
MRQLHTRGVFVPVKLESLTDKEREKLMEIFFHQVINLHKARDGNGTGKTCNCLFCGGTVYSNSLTFVAIDFKGLK